MGAVDKCDNEFPRKTIVQKVVFFFVRWTFGIRIVCINSKQRKIFHPDSSPNIMRQILQKYYRGNFVKIIIRSLDKNPFGPTARHFPLICTGNSDRKSAARKFALFVSKMTDDSRKLLFIVKFET